MSRDLDEDTRSKESKLKQDAKDRFKKEESKTHKKKQRSRVKSKKKRKYNELRFDDEPVIFDSRDSRGRRKASAKSKAVYAYDGMSIASRLGDEAIHTSDMGDAEDNNVSADAGNNLKYIAKRRLVQSTTRSRRFEEKDETKPKSRLRFESEKDSPKDAMKVSGSTDNKSKKLRNKVIPKRRLRNEYAKAYKAAKDGKQVSNTAASSKAVKSVASKAKDVAIRIVRNNAPVVIGLCVIGIVVITIVSVFGTTGSLFSQMGGAVVSSTYLSADNEMLSANSAYEDMEVLLQNQIDRIETDYPGYDEYRYQVDELTHDPYALTSYLTAMYGSYVAVNLSSELEDLFKEQFSLVITESTETRTRPAPTSSNPNRTEEYEVKILNVSVVNNGIDTIARGRLDSSHLTHYSTLQACLGNRPDLFGDASYGNVAGGGIQYEIPPEALGDARFANMIREAERHLGTPYVWGGYAPGGFDCSGFVSYVLNNCGNGWNFGRLTANGLKNTCTIISPSAAQPGDLIFFERTYNTAGASHVGIYVGNGMMIHCGRPVQYTSINSNYWQSHFLCYGRLP